MRSLLLLAACSFLISAKSNALVKGRVITLDGSSISAESPTKSLSQFLNAIGAYDLNRLQISESTAPDSQCGDAYFIDITVHGFWNDVQAKVDFYAQTLTKESQDRLYKAIHANYATKGLPACLLHDEFYPNYLTAFMYHYDPDQTTVLIPSRVMTVPAGYPCAGRIGRPMTSCWNLKDPYSK